MGAIQVAVSKLPYDNAVLLRYLWLVLSIVSMPGHCNHHSEFLSEVVSQSEVNKMGLENIATVFGPNFLTPKEVRYILASYRVLKLGVQSDNVEALIQSTALVHKLTCTLISEHKRAFEVMPVVCPRAYM